MNYISQCFLYFVIKRYVACLVFIFFFFFSSVKYCHDKNISTVRNKCYGVIQINIMGFLL